MSFWIIVAASLVGQFIGVALFGIGGYVVGRIRRARLQRRLGREFAGAAQPTFQTAEAGQPVVADLGGECHGHGSAEHGLDPCPFCRHSELTVTRFDPRPGGPPTTEFAVFCYTCGAYGPAYAQPERSEDAWNKAARGSEAV